mmetsp:Transcript_24226/g.83219  ORF Transcript_24226/g.83219 Transcript_24226/m.83219 type:complete len:233 (+) Transcript_24226:694-1392(+)
MNELEAPDLDDVLLGVGLGLRRLEERVDVEAAAADADALDAEPRQGVVGRRAGGGARRRLVRAVVVERGRVKAARGVARAALVRARLALLVRDAQRRPEVQALGVALQVELHALDLEVVDVDGRRGAAAAAGQVRVDAPRAEPQAHAAELEQEGRLLELLRVPPHERAQADRDLAPAQVDREPGDLDVVIHAVFDGLRRREAEDVVQGQVEDENCRVNAHDLRSRSRISTRA